MPGVRAARTMGDLGGVQRNGTEGATQKKNHPLDHTIDLINKHFGHDWSARVKFDTQKAKDDTKTHPEGTWDAKVLDAEAKKTKTDKDMIQITWKTSVGKLKSWTTYVPDYPGLFLKPMYALGLTAAYFDGDPSMEEVADKIEGLRALIEVVHEPYRDGVTASIGAINPIPGAESAAPGVEPF